MKLCAVLIPVLMAAACDGQAPPIPPIGPSSARTVRVTGSVIESGSRTAVAGVTIAVNGQSTATDAKGAFALAVEVSSLASLLSVAMSREGYEPAAFNVGFDKVTGAPDRALDVVLQRRLELHLESSFSAQLFPDDPGTYVGEPYDSEICTACKLIHFETPLDGDLSLALSWPGSPALRMWILGETITDAPTADGQRRVLQLPRGTRGTLIIGTPFPETVTSAIPFSLGLLRDASGRVQP